MKITPQLPERQPMTATIIKAVGLLQFFAVGGVTFILLFRFLPETWCMLIALIAAISASLTAFVVARIIGDIHAIRINTDGYVTESEREDYRPILQAMRRLNDNLEQIQEILSTIHSDYAVRDEDSNTQELETEPLELDIDTLFQTEKDSGNEQKQEKLR